MIRLAKLKEIDQIMTVVKQAVALMKVDGNDQWNDTYPSRDSLLQNINSNELYILEIKEDIAAMIVIEKRQDFWYEQVKWVENDSFYVLHRLAVASDFRRQGLGKKMIEFSISKANENHVAAIKADTYSKNQKMKKLFVKLGFTYVGDIYFNNKKLPYYCYEYILDV